MNYAWTAAQRLCLINVTPAACQSTASAVATHAEHCEADVQLLRSDTFCLFVRLHRSLTGVCFPSGSASQPSSFRGRHLKMMMMSSNPWGSWVSGGCILSPEHREGHPTSETSGTEVHEAAWSCEGRPTAFNAVERRRHDLHMTFTGEHGSAWAGPHPSVWDGALGRSVTPISYCSTAATREFYFFYSHQTKQKKRKTNVFMKRNCTRISLKPNEGLAGWVFATRDSRFQRFIVIITHDEIISEELWFN